MVIDNFLQSMCAIAHTAHLLPQTLDGAYEKIENYRLTLEVETDLVGVLGVVVGKSFRPRIGLFVGTSGVAEFFLGSFETGR